MKPSSTAFAIVTATLDPLRAKPCLESWLGLALYRYPIYVVWSTFPLPEGAPTPDQRIYHQALKDGTHALVQACPGVSIVCRHGGGVVPAFAEGVALAFTEGAEAVLCLHDDVLIQESGWDAWLGKHRQYPFCGFGGASGLADADIYRKPYEPHQLARIGFASNLRDAEAHGGRITDPMPAVVFDGFSQCGTKAWFKDAWEWLATSGIQHHAYDAALGCLAARAGVKGTVLPVRCHHLGGQTAVGSQAYHEWAKTTPQGSDAVFWQEAHRIVYEEFTDVLPLRLPR